MANDKDKTEKDRTEKDKTGKDAVTPSRPPALRSYDGYVAATTSTASTPYNNPSTTETVTADTVTTSTAAGTTAIVAPPTLSSSSPASTPIPVLIKEEEIKLGEEISSGAFGTVYKGKYKGKTVAIKQINLSQDPKKVLEEVIEHLENTPTDMMATLKKDIHEIETALKNPTDAVNKLKKLIEKLKTLSGQETYILKLKNEAILVEEELEKIEKKLSDPKVVLERSIGQLNDFIKKTELEKIPEEIFLELKKEMQEIEKISKKPNEAAAKLKTIAASLQKLSTDVKTQGKPYAYKLKSEVALLEKAAKNMEKELKDLEEEFRIMKTIRSPYTVGALGYSLMPPFLVMDLMSNNLKNYFETLSSNNSNTSKSDPNKPDNTASHKTNTEEILSKKSRFVFEIANGLSAIHRARIVHRDLKPENILIDQTDTIRIADFGLSKSKSITKYSIKVNSALHLIRDDFVGTFQYLSPELLEEQPPDSEPIPRPYSVASDVYSFGMIVWSIYSGKKPYKGMDDNVVIEEKKKGIVSLTKPEDCPEVMWTLMRHCWNADPAKRPGMDSIVQYLRDPKFYDLSKAPVPAITPLTATPLTTNSAISGPNQSLNLSSKPPTPKSFSPLTGGTPKQETALPITSNTNTKSPEKNGDQKSKKFTKK